MKRKSGYRLLWVLFGLLVFCLATAGPHRLMNNLLFFGTVCCDNLPQYLPTNSVAWAVIGARSLIIITLVTGVGLFVRRVGQLSTFLGVLQAASATLPPRLAALCAQVGLADRVYLLPTPVPLAFCTGLLQPRIYLSRGLVAALTDKELRAVLVHEDHHRRQRDPLRTLLADLVAQLFFFLPVVAEWRERFCLECELAADRYAIHKVGRLPLAAALHKLLTYPPLFPVPVGLGGISGFSVTQARLTQLLDNLTVSLPFSHRSLLRSSAILILTCLVLQIALL